MIALNMNLSMFIFIIMSNKNFKRQFGIPRNIFNHMLNILEKAHAEKHKFGGRPEKISLEEKLKMTLEYWREYRTYFSIAQSRNIAENTCFRNILWVENTLIKSGQFNLPNRQEVVEDKNITKVIIDATETPIERPVKSNRKWYSGKKKMHTIQTQFIIDGDTGKILSVSTSEGKKHDFKLWKESKKIIPENTTIMADSGYNGMKKRHKKSHISVKKNGKKS
jgi:hypothetical protein